MTARSTFSVRPIWTAGLGLAAATLLIAGCASSSSTATGSTLPKLHIGSGTTNAGAVPGAMAAPEAPVAAGRASVFAGYVLAGTLPDQPTHAPIWQWQSGGATQADMTKLAAALGVTGTPKRHAYGWELTTATADLRISDAAGHPWSYDKTSAESCPTFQVDVDNADAVVNGCAMAPPVSSQQPTNGPDQTATEAAATTLLSALGITGDEQVDVGAPSSTLTVSPRLGGLPTEGIETTVAVDASGIIGATGQLDAPTAGDDYPLRTAAAAFTQLNDEPRPMMAPFCGPIPVGSAIPLPQAPTPVTAPTVVTPAVPASPPPSVAIVAPLSASAVASPPSSPTAFPPASPVSCPTPQPVKVTGATIGLQIEYDATADDAPIMAPAWFFTTADSSNVGPIVAIDPAFLEGPSTPTAVASAVTGSASGSLVAVPPAFPPASKPAS